MEFVVPSTIGNNPLYITINNTKYTLGPGTTVNVPEAVITEVQRMMEAQSKEAPAVEPPWASGGGGGGALVVISDENGVLDKTWKEIYDAPFAVLTNIDVEDGAKLTALIDTVYFERGTYTVHAGDMSFHTDSEDGYPGVSDGGGD